MSRRGDLVSWLVSVAEDRGFEPLRAFTQHAFQACALGHYANPPPQRVPPCATRPDIAVAVTKTGKHSSPESPPAPGTALAGVVARECGCAGMTVGLPVDGPLA